MPGTLVVAAVILHHRGTQDTVAVVPAGTLRGCERSFPAATDALVRDVGAGW